MKNQFDQLLREAQLKYGVYVEQGEPQPPPNVNPQAPVPGADQSKLPDAAMPAQTPEEQPDNEFSATDETEYKSTLINLLDVVRNMIETLKSKDENMINTLSDLYVEINPADFDTISHQVETSNTRDTIHLVSQLVNRLKNATQ